jgi:hypothetical protein
MFNKSGNEKRVTSVVRKMEEKRKKKELTKG